MKKHGLFKVLGLLLLLVAIVSFVLAGRSGEKDFIGLADIGFNSFKSVYYFFYLAVYVLSIGGFYGVLNKSPKYKKLLDKITRKFKPLRKKFIFIIIILFAIITSLTGITLPLLVFVPFIMAIILSLGYDKLVAVSSTVVSSMIGYVGGVYVTFYNPSTYKMTTFDSFVGANSSFTNVFPKILLLFAGITLLIYFVNSHIKSVESKKVKYELEDNSEVQINEVASDYDRIKTWPIAVLFIVLFVILVLGLVPWNTLFGITVFTDFHTWLTELSIKEFAIIPSLIGSDLLPFGEWFSMGDSMTYMTISIIIVLFTFIAALVGRVKFNDMIEAFKEGMKKFLPIAILIMLSLTILISAYTNGFFEYLVSSYGKFNYGISSLLVFLGCLLNVDMYYIAAGVFTPILNVITDKSVYTSVSILFQGIYGIFSIVGPTSMILLFALGYMNIPYTTWIRYIWRFILALIILLALVTMLIVFI